MKIGIVTLNGYYNYGNRLQNYALQKVLGNLSTHPVQTVRINEEKIRMSKKNIKGKVKMVYGNIVGKFKNEINSNRTKKFKEFSKEYLHETTFELNEQNIERYREDLLIYDFVVTGSDQVWNPYYNAFSGLYFLNFIPKEKRISYAASFGISDIPEEYRQDYTQWLAEMDSISVREIAGSNIVKELTGKSVSVLSDPTLLLTREDWKLIAKKARNRPTTPYLLTYFLGGPTPETLKKLEKIANEKGMKIINLGDPKDRDTYETGPSEFLDYIENASAFFTDSFHGVVFSIIFQTPFIVYERLSAGGTMYSRIETILDNFNLRSRESKNKNIDIFSMDYSDTNKILEIEYTKSVNYLKEALGIEE